MPTVETLGAFFVAAVILGLAPGPDNIFVLTQSALYGARAGLVTVLGLVTGLCVHTAAVALGAAAVLGASPVAFAVLKCAGAAYLLYLAWLTWRSGPVRSPEQAPELGTELGTEQGTRQGTRQGTLFSYWALYRRGVIMSMTNPKVTLFFLALLPQFADPARGPVAVQIVVLGMLFQLATILVFGAVALLGGWLARHFNSSPRAQRVLNKVAACVFIAMAVMLLIASA